jgi:glycosyltransferase involved in cell wall biosynthesis
LRLPRILYHHRTRAFDGQAVHIQEMLRAFGAEGMEVEEVALVKQGRTQEVSRQGESRPARKKSFWQNLRLPRMAVEVAEHLYSKKGCNMLVRAGRCAGFDLIYERHALNCRSALWASRKLELPFFLEVNSPMVAEMEALGLLRFPSWARRVESEILSAADRIFVVSEVLGRMLLPLGAREECIVVTPNGADLPPFEQAYRQHAERVASGRAPRVLGFIGFPRKWHRLDLALHALAALRADWPELELRILGDGPAISDLQELATSLGISEALVVLGACPREELPGRVADLDLALIPAMNDYASPLKLYDSLAAGVPTLAPDQPNLRESVTDGETAFLFEPSQQESFTGKLREILEDAERSCRIGEAGRQSLIDEDRTWESNARRVRQEWQSMGGAS